MICITNCVYYVEIIIVIKHFLIFWTCFIICNWYHYALDKYLLAAYKLTYSIYYFVMIKPEKIIYYDNIFCSYLFFWDKIERSHYWLNNIVQTARQGEELDGRLVNFLLKVMYNNIFIYFKFILVHNSKLQMVRNPWLYWIYKWNFIRFYLVFTEKWNMYG